MNMLKFAKRSAHCAWLLGAAVCAAPALADTVIDATRGLAEVSSPSAQAADAGTPAARIYERVNGKIITLQEYGLLYAYTLTSRGEQDNLSNDRKAELGKEITATLENHLLLLDEAARRGIKPRQEDVDRAVAAEEEKNKDNPAWQGNHARLLAQLQKLAAEQSMLGQLEAAVKNLPAPRASDVRFFYNTHHALFTEPEKMRFSVILLNVAPEAPDEAWQQNMSAAQEIVGKVKDGEDFHELAKEFSADKSAADGGDVGYLHRAELPEQLRNNVDRLKAGEISAPFKGAEGILIYRLEERIPPDLKSFDKSEKRAAELLLYEQKEHAWDALLVRLRGNARIELINKPVAVPAS